MHGSNAGFRVLFISQRQAERMRAPLRCALISITDPAMPQARLRPGWSATLRLSFDDADPVAFPGMNADLAPMHERQAAELARYVLTQVERCNRIVVHCRHGISRSSAVAKAIAEKMGASFPPSYREYNRHVFLLVQRALAAQNYDCFDPWQALP